MKIVPPNFGYVEDNIFRCGSPDPRHYGFLGSLGLRTCILLTDVHDAAFVRWLQECGIQVLCPLTAEPRSLAAAPPQQQAAAEGASSPYYSSAAGGGDRGSVPVSGGFTANGSLASPSFGGGGGGSAFPAVSAESPAEADEAGGAARHSNVARFLKENLADRHHSPVGTERPLVGALLGQPYSHFPPASPCAAGASDHRSLMSLPEPVVVSLLHVMLDPQYYPLLVTCAKGRYRTGIVCGCLRKIQNWSLLAILEEYRRYAGDKSRGENEEFIELFDRDLVNVTLEGGRRPPILYHLA